jgi:hypothetical protein
MKRITKEESQFHIPFDTGTINSSIRVHAFSLIPHEDGWEKVQYYGESVLDRHGNIRKPEWIYVLVNRLMPGIIKIGMTTTTVNQRVKEINSATGVIDKWFPIFTYKCVHSHDLEQEIHKYLQNQGHRINPNREGFDLDVKTAINVIKDLGEKYQTPLLNNT